MTTEEIDESLDDGPEKGRKKVETVRRCLATGERKPRDRMIRFVVGPDDEVVPDLKASLPGRGMWLSADRESIKTACERSLFSRAARRRVVAPEDLADRVEALLARRCADWLSRANRAGAAVTGFEKVRAALKADASGIVLAARDGADDGRRKISALAGQRPVIALLTAQEIAGAFGKDNAVHVWVAPGGLADGLMADAARLAGFRLTESPEEEG
ncbi:RNA-binding protein [Aestuariispira ectoiniformans]|uniref:RNA-binding protein n=1 Tax=Aestuariispira ectoiniformans TaxID=2775080 RepID=UPI00223B9937|nr:RNA-binding protein [Aestuariispira ectoiniformans]